MHGGECKSGVEKNGEYSERNTEAKLRVLCRGGTGWEFMQNHVCRVIKNKARKTINNATAEMQCNWRGRYGSYFGSKINMVEPGD